MKLEKCTKEAFKVVGLTVRANNKYEMSMETSRIFPIVQKFVQEKWAEKIQGRIEPGTLICGYMDYVTDHNGDYTYFIGEIVDSATQSAPAEMTFVDIPAQEYAKITNGPAPMPQVVQEPWMKVWKMSAEELGGERAYKVDFEVYDERAKDHSAIVLDVLVGLK